MTTRTNDDAAVIVFTVVMAGAVALAIAGDISAPLCATARQAAGKAWIGCVEFWIERYQGLFGGLLALIGAGVTVFAMRWQTNETHRRSRKIASMRSLSILRAFHDSCMESFNSPRYSQNNDKRPQALRIPAYYFTDNPELLADIPNDLALKIFHLGRIVEQTRKLEEYVGIADDFHWIDFYGGHFAYLAEESFDLINDCSDILGWYIDIDRPSDDSDVEHFLTVRKELYERRA
jgi:hypothetical protein